VTGKVPWSDLSGHDAAVEIAQYKLPPELERLKGDDMYDVLKSCFIFYPKDRLPFMNLKKELLRKMGQDVQLVDEKALKSLQAMAQHLHLHEHHRSINSEEMSCEETQWTEMMEGKNLKMTSSPKVASPEGSETPSVKILKPVFLKQVVKGKSNLRKMRMRMRMTKERI
jgi:hypothetical protein